MKVIAGKVGSRQSGYFSIVVGAGLIGLVFRV